MNFIGPDRQLVRALFQNKAGQVFVTFAIALFGFMAMAAMVVDGGQAYHQKRWAQDVADMASLSAAQKFASAAVMGTATNQIVDEARDEARRVILANGYTNLDIINWQPTDGTDTVNSGGIQVGTYPAGGPFTATTTSPTAVRVQLQRSVTTTLAKVIGISSIKPSVSSVAITAYGGSADCVLPFAVSSASITTGGGTPLSPGSTFVVGTNSGQWGTISTSPDFFSTINGGSCGASFSVGDQPSSDNGNITQINNAFNAHLEPDYFFIIPVSSTIPTTGSQNFNIAGFIKISVVQSRRQGSNLITTFRLIEYVTGSGNPFPSGTPTPTGAIGGRTRVLAQ